MQGLGVCDVISLNGYEYPNNYYTAFLKNTDGKFWLYFNCFVSIAGIKQNEKTAEFVDIPSVKSALYSLNSEIHLPCAEDLDAPVVEATKIKLTKGERNEVKGWLPATVGDLLFCSYFD